MYQATTQIRVRYAETDQMGHVYHGNYAIYHEVARVDAMKQIGFSYKGLEDSGIMMPVYENSFRYILPALYDQLLTIKVIVDEPPRVKMTFRYEITNEEEKLIHTGSTTLFFMDIKSQRPVRAPQHIIELMAPYFNEG
ncbi:MAG: acyl-CoA thioesterase [Roseivirga sp.]|nr:acyl-CoA thioesterase [Roseivirga sp.]